MRTLVIDSATEACSVALFDDVRLLSGEFAMLGRGHAELLVPMISRLPERGRADRIVVSLGPGSFTGVRVGIAAARALALAWSADLGGYPAPALVAAMARAQFGREPIGVAMTGGHGEWFVTGFDADGKTSRPLQSVKPETAVTASTEEIIAGSEAEALVAARRFGRAAPLWPDAREFPSIPAHIISDRIAPLYGRAPDARLPGGLR